MTVETKRKRWSSGETVVVVVAVAVLIALRDLLPGDGSGAVLGWALRVVFLLGISALLAEAVAEFRRGYAGEDEDSD